MDKSTRLEELEGKFSELESRLKESPEKQALSILHAIIHESRRLQVGGRGGPAPAERTVAPSRQDRPDVAELYKSAPPMQGKAENEGLPAGTPAPDFSLPDANGRIVSLADYRGQTVVLVFYPLDWSPACSDQLSLYQSELEEFERYGARVLGISVDSLYSHGAWAAVRELSIPLLADFHPKGETARRYRVFRESDGFSERALFIVDGEGVIRYSYVSPELHHVPDIYDLMEQLKGISRQTARDGRERVSS
jgi:peroxiredoxin